MEWILRSARRSWRDETDACWREICNRSMYWPSVNAAAAWSANPLMERGLMIGLLIAPEASLNFLYEKETIKSNLLSRRHQMELETEKKRKVFLSGYYIQYGVLEWDFWYPAARARDSCMTSFFFLRRRQSLSRRTEDVISSSLSFPF